MTPKTQLGTFYETHYLRRGVIRKRRTLKIFVRQTKTPSKLELVRSLANIHGTGRVCKSSYSRTIKVIKREKAEKTGKNINNQ